MGDRQRARRSGGGKRGANWRPAHQPSAMDPTPPWETRGEARKAAARRAARRRRRWFLIGGAVAAVLGFVAVSLGVSGGSEKHAATDSAVRTKPAVSAGTGELKTLTVTVLIQGTGEPVRAGQKVSVNYVGVFYKTGEEFDSSWSRSRRFEFTVGEGKVIQGWDQGLIGVKVGSRVQLDVPSDLAYGDDPGDSNPSGPLRFVVDVVSAT